jgi:hypothetical protein
MMSKDGSPGAAPGIEGRSPFGEALSFTYDWPLTAVEYA